MHQARLLRRASLAAAARTAAATATSQTRLVDLLAGDDDVALDCPVAAEPVLLPADVPADPLGALLGAVEG